MADDVSVTTTSADDAVVFSFTETSTPVTFTSSITVSDVLVTVNESDSSVAVAVTDEITDVSVTVANTTQPISIAVTEAITDVVVEVENNSVWVQSFDTVSRNLSGYPYTVNWNVDKISSIVFDLGTTTITKTFNYTSTKLTSIVLSGYTPSGINLTKTLTYSGDLIQSITYS